MIDIMDYDLETYDEFVHHSELDRFEEAKWHLSEIVKALYVTGNKNKFEDSLEEVLAVFNMQIPKDNIKLQITGE